MIGTTVSHYRILEKLGEGGMGVVYKADDLSLHRTVALKFLACSSLDDQRDKEAFVREARAAAALDHPGVCTVYEINESDGRIFIAMAYIDGPSLREKLEAGRIPAAEAVKLATQVAAGLNAAHQCGIVHRDVKGGNIMIGADGRAKLVDFGLARAIELDPAGETAVLEGTPAWMSPEQLRGEPLDARTDIWSLGVVLYEMLAGKAPFSGRYPGQVVYSVLHEDPDALAPGNPEIAPELDGIIGKALAKRREDRYANAGELLADLKAFSAGALAGLPRRTGDSAETRRSIAVLAFADMSPEKDQEYFCDGLAEEIIGCLTHLTGLRVASRTSSFAYKGRPGDVRTIGRELGVETVLEGSVRKADNQLRITCQLIEVAGGYHLWSDQYDRELCDIFAIQEEIAQSVARALEVELSEREAQAMVCCPTHDVEAYDFYLRGRLFFYRSKRQDIEYAKEMFLNAVARDPEYALAHAGLADCHSYLYMYFGGREDDRDRACETSAEALRLDPSLAEAHAARGLALSHALDYEEAEREFRRAIRLNPGLFEAYYFYARSCFAQGKAEQAALLYEQAAEVNPTDLQAVSLLAFTHLGLGNRDEALATYRRSLARIEKHLELNPDDARAYYLGACARLEIGELDRCWEMAQRALELGRDDPYTIYGLACLCARSGRIDQALEYLAVAIEHGFAHKEWIDRDTDLDPLRDDARFAALIEELETRQARPSST